MKDLLKGLSPKLISIIVGSVAIVSIGAYFISSSPLDKATTYVETEVNEEFAQYISAFTSGDLSINSTIRIRFTEEQIDKTKIGEIDSRDLFNFSPNLNGTAKWVDLFTLEFTPDEWLKSDEVYDVGFELSQLIEVPKELETFEFNFHTYKQDLEVTTNDFISSAENLKKVTLTGVVHTADITKTELLEKTLVASQGSENLEITWNHPRQNDHHFSIENITRFKEQSTVTLSWDGNAIGVDTQGSIEYQIPALGDFKILKVETQSFGESHLLISFTDPLDTKQNLTGLISAVKQDISFQCTIENNFIKAYPSKKVEGPFEVVIHKEIKNILGDQMKKDHKVSVEFEHLKPAVRAIGKGIIVPKSNGLIFPFEAVSLRAVDVTIIEIFENNTIQFFQENNMDGKRKLKRVARPIFRQSLVLNHNKLLNLNKWNRFTIDLAELITPTPGAIYQVEIAFRRSQAVFTCGGEEPNDKLRPIKPENWTAESYTNYSYWDSYGEDYHYDWNERDNPCNETYYRSGNKSLVRNIIASNLGIIAKRGTDNVLFTALTDITTSEPLAGVEIDVFDFQQQLIASGKTDVQGFFEKKTDIKPFLIKAKKGEDINYLKVDDGTALSMSNFNVGGAKVKKGLKGFIYGERGVWRPGDTLFMTFILEDKNKTLPKNHPVIFELYNPDGKVEHRSVKTKNINGFYTFQPYTDDNDQTGNWMIHAKVGNTTFKKTVKIEAIKPNKLKINLDYGQEFLTAENEVINGDLEVKWLHGGIAKNLDAEFELVLSKGQTKFERYNTYSFEDQSKTFYPETSKIFGGKLDENGNAKVPTSISIDGDAPGVLNATFKGKVFEPSGEFSVDQFTIPYYPYESFVGLRLPEGDHRGMLLTDKEHSVDILSLTPKGIPKGNQNVQVEVYELSWKWWWDQSSNSSSNYIGVDHREPIDEAQVSLTNGKGTYKLRINYPSWGRYYIRIKDLNSGHSAGKIFYMDWPGWAGKSKRAIPDAASMLTFSSDKQEYAVGETMKLTIPGSGAGNALVSIESGSKIVETQWVKLNKGENQIDLKVTNKMTPNVFVHVTALQPHDQTINDHPIRMYGVIPIDVVDKNTHLTPTLQMPKVLSPGKKVPITVSEKDGRPMTFTVAVVDEGLLSLTKFKTPNPWPVFYQHEALGVATWDMYKYVLGAYGGELEKALAIGGDGLIQDKDGAKTKRFKPVVKFFGPYHLDASEKKNISFTMPNYIGAVRTMVIGGYEGAYGKTEKETPVRQSLMVLGTLPRVLSPGEKLRLPVNVFAYKNDIKSVDVTVKSTGPVKIIESKKQVKFSKKGDKLAFFEIETAKTIGNSQIIIEAKSGDKVAKHVIDIEVRNPNQFVTNYHEKVLQPGETFNYSFKTPGMRGTNAYAIEAATIPPLNLGRRLQYLMRYPHGCVEQTTSAAFPQLFLSTLMDLTSNQKSEVENNVKKAIDRLASMQVNNGGFGYWPNASEASTWGSNYAGHFLVLAKKKGYFVSNSILNDWKQFQRKKAKNWSRKSNYNSDLQQAYRLYTLALSGSPEKGAMNRLKEKSLSKTAQYILAAAYGLIGRDEVAKSLISSAPNSIKKYKEYSYTYGSTFRDEAMLLLTLNTVGDVNNGLAAVKRICKRLSSPSWMNTQETAWSLLAVSDYIGRQPTTSSVKFDLTINKETTSIGLDHSLFKKDITENALKDKSITIKNTSSGVLYLNLSSSGQPLIDNRESSNEVINMEVTYTDKSGNEIDPFEIEQGTDFLMNVKIKNTGLRGPLKELALSTIFPSGWQVQNSRMDAVANHYQTATPDYQDYRDDRVFTYFDLPSGVSKTFTFLINPTFAGEFTLPGIQCEAMYDNAVKAFYKGGKTRVMK